MLQKEKKILSKRTVLRWSIVDLPFDCCAIKTTMTALYRLELLLSMRSKLLPGTKASQALDRIIYQFQSQIKKDLEGELLSIKVYENLAHSNDEDLDSI